MAEATTKSSGTVAADSTREGDAKLGQEYDKNRADEVKVDSKKVGDGFTNNGGVISAGQSQTAVTHFPGAEARGLHKADGPDGQLVKGYLASLSTDPTPGWTAQSAGAYTGDPGQPDGVLGQTYSVEELPDAKVLAAAGVAYAIPASHVVDGNVTDNISSAQERAGTQQRGDGRVTRTSHSTANSDK